MVFDVSSSDCIATDSIIVIISSFIQVSQPFHEGAILSLIIRDDVVLGTFMYNERIILL